jgi:hypothetical protein
MLSLLCNGLYNLLQRGRGVNTYDYKCLKRGVHGKVESHDGKKCSNLEWKEKCLKKKFHRLDISLKSLKLCWAIELMVTSTSEKEGQSSESQKY